jgi:hypothetical protein
MQSSSWRSSARSPSRASFAIFWPSANRHRNAGGGLGPPPFGALWGAGGGGKKGLQPVPAPRQHAGGPIPIPGGHPGCRGCRRDVGCTDVSAKHIERDVECSRGAEGEPRRRLEHKIALHKAASEVRYVVIFNNGSPTEPNGVSELSLAPHRVTLLTTKHSPAEIARKKSLQGWG